MARLSHRFFALTMAVLFLVTSSSIALLFILANVESKDNSSSNSVSNTNKLPPSANKSKSTNTKVLSGFVPVSSVSQIKTTDLVVGKGQAIKSGSPSVNDGVSVSVTYTGALAATGVIFQSSSTPITLQLSQVILGWQLGMQGMQIGGTRQILIPAQFAYGANPPAGSGIPANAPLVFDVTLKSISG